MVNRQLANPAEHSLGKLRSIAQIDARGERCDRVLIEPTTQVGGTAEARTNNTGHASERLLRALAAEHLAVLTEVVQIEQQERQPPRFALGETPVALQQVFEIRTSQQASELVVTQVGEHGLRVHAGIARVAAWDALSAEHPAFAMEAGVVCEPTA